MVFSVSMLLIDDLFAITIKETSDVLVEIANRILGNCINILIQHINNINHCGIILQGNFFDSARC